MMKELKFNLRYLANRREVYFAFIAILAVCFIHAAMVIYEAQYFEFKQTGEYLFILSNSIVSLTPVILLVFPVIGTLILSDSSWLDNNRKTITLLYMRLNYKKNIIVRWGLSILITFLIVFLGLMLNYLILRILFGSGNKIVLAQSMAYNLTPVPHLFLDSIRMNSPTLFVVLASCHVSLLLGLLSGLSYCFSFYVRQRLVIYFQVLLMMFGYEIISSFLKFNNLSIIRQLQIMSSFTILDVAILYMILIGISIILLVLFFRKREVVL